MEATLSIMIIGGIVALVIWSKRRSAADREAKMVPYRTYWIEARRLNDSEKIVDAARKLINAARYWDRGSSAYLATEAYRTCLPLLRGRPDFRPVLLELGRASYGWPRPDGVPTVYDEQAIANDIAAHS